MTIEKYMKYCLFYPGLGYYQKENIFGQKGDFITSPGISQLFGEVRAFTFYNLSFIIR